MTLSEHFFLHEFTWSATAARMGREVIPTDDQIANLKRLCTSLLEPIRWQLGRPIVITSGLRPDWLNKAIGGAANSDHMYGRAADVQVVGMSSAVFARWVQKRGFAVQQCIVEYGQWVHLSIPAADKPRNEFLTASVVEGRTVYSVGV